MKRTKGEVRALGGVRALKRVGALSLLAFNLLVGPWGPVSLSCSSMRSAGKLLQGLRQAQDLGAIAMEI